MEPALLNNALRGPVTLPGGNDHPVVNIPFTALIDGRQLRGRGLSLVAAYVSGLMDPQAVNTTRIVRLIFQLDGFSVTLVADAEVREDPSGSGTAELIFKNPTGPHLPQLRHLLNAFIAGDLVGIGQTIGVAGTAAAKGPKAATAPESRLSLRRLAGGLGVGLLTIALIAVAGTLAYQRMFITLVPTLGTVVSTGDVMRATATGQIVFFDLNAAKGDVAVAIQAASGDVQSLLMPCDCVVTANGLGEGSTVLIGEPLLQMTSATDQTVVTATIPPEMLFDLAKAATVDLTFPDGTILQASLEAGSVLQGSDAVTLMPNPALDPARLGQPVEIRIQHDTGRLGTVYNDLANRASTLIGVN